MTITSRARPLSLDERRASIIEAVIPLLLDHGQAVTSRQIADAAGVAEGTVFRAFGDKESLIQEAYDAFMRGAHASEVPLPDPALPLEDKLAAFLTGMRKRVRGVMRMSFVVGRRPAQPDDTQQTLFRWRVREVFQPHAHELSLDLEEFGSYLRALAIGTTVPGVTLDDDTLARIILDGIRRPQSAPGTGKD